MFCLATFKVYNLMFRENDSPPWMMVDHHDVKPSGGFVTLKCEGTAWKLDLCCVV